eukprot:TRINITY_DN4397_c0_g1_i19.p1 TRINITY_DN4397_c0_g1~~TRINITY_DN4397_c0_g1_i19.p1  ORF type:complete len:230 (+),score=23.16 TRINITY_DN4397_c0_g1_i19:346-1035(+)
MKRNYREVSQGSDSNNSSSSLKSLPSKCLPSPVNCIAAEGDVRKMDVSRQRGKQEALPRIEPEDGGDHECTRFDNQPLVDYSIKAPSFPNFTFDNIEKIEHSSIRKINLKSRDSKKTEIKKDLNDSKTQEDQTPPNRCALHKKKRKIEDTCERRCNAADMVMRLQVLTDNLLGFNTERNAMTSEELCLSESVVAQQMELLRRFSGYAERLLNISESLFELVNSANKTKP